MGFESSIQDISTQALAAANGLVSDFAPYLAMLVGVMILGFMIKWFIDQGK